MMLRKIYSNKNKPHKTNVQSVKHLLKQLSKTESHSTTKSKTGKIKLTATDFKKYTRIMRYSGSDGKPAMAGLSVSP